MNINKALQLFLDIESDLLLAHVIKQPKDFLYMHSTKEVTQIQLQKFKGLCDKRLSGMPIAYILGYKYFYGLKFKVNRNVLIPRPESEWLVDTAKKITRKNISKKLQSLKKFKILDVGTGSGCIAISIAQNIASKKVHIYASDISMKALTVAEHNARAHKVNVQFSQSDLFINVKGKFDIIIANLPYVPLNDYKKFYANLKYEPQSALTDGGDDFVILKEFVAQARNHITENGTILLEIDPKAMKELKPLIKSVFKGHKIKNIKDLQGLHRFIQISKM